ADYSNSKGRVFDSQVIAAASKRGLSPEEMTRILAAGPYSQSLANRNVAEANQYLRSKMMPYESAHRNNDLAAFDKLLQTKPEAAFAFTVAQAKENIVSAVKQGYQALAMTEKALFAIAPVPLNPLKSGIRQITPALLATTVAAKLPGMDYAISSAMHFGGHMLSNVSSMVTTNALSNLGHNIASNLPTGFGVQTAAGGIGYATTATLGTLAKTGGQVVGQLGVALTIGNGIVKGGTAIAQSVAEKGVLVTLQDASTAISRAQKWAINAQNQIQEKIQSVSAKIKGKSTMSKQYDFNDPNIQGIGVSETENSIYERRRDSTVKPELETKQNSTYKVVDGAFLVPDSKSQTPVDAFSFQTMDSLFEVEGMDPSLVKRNSDLKVVSPAKVSMLDDGTFAVTEKGKLIRSDLFVGQEPVSLQAEVASQSFEPSTNGYNSEHNILGDEPLSKQEYVDKDYLAEPDNNQVDIDSNAAPQQFYDGNTTKDAPPSYPEPYETTQDQQSMLSESTPASEEDRIHDQMDELYSEQAKSQSALDLSELSEDNRAALPLSDIAQNASKENTQYINSLQQELSQKGIDIQRLEVFFDGKQQFKMKDYQIAKSDVSNEAIEMLKLARTDPANLEGEVMIKQGSKVLFHVKDGEVLIDALRLSEQAVTAKVTTPTKALWDKSSDGIRSSGLKQVQEVSEAAFKSGADFAQVSKMNESYNPEYSKMKDQLGSEAVENVIKSAEAKATVAMNPTESQQQTKTISKGI
ncbi:MAG: hypothetical protein ACRCYP_03925, partial [Alphaproteobacteria bacterium]